MNLSRYLSPAERIVLVTRRHVWVLASDSILFLLCVGVAIAAQTPIVAGIVLIVSIRFLWKALDWFCDRLILTNQRIIGVSGLLTRHVASMPLAMMTDLTYQRSFLGRLLGFGSIRVESAGQDQGLSKIHFIPDPDHFYRTVASLLHPELDVTDQQLVEIQDPEAYAEEALALVRRGSPKTTWDPDDTNPNMIVLP